MIPHISKLRKPFRHLCFYLQELSVGLFAGMLAWNVSSFIKEMLVLHYAPNLNSWADKFYDPEGSGLLNYIVLCAVLLLYGFWRYLRPEGNKYVGLRKRCSTVFMRFPILLFSILAIFIISANYRNPIITRVFINSAILIYLILPVTNKISMGIESFKNKLISYKEPFRNKMTFHKDMVSIDWRQIIRRLCTNINPNKLIVASIFILFVIYSIEPLRAAFGPVYLFNEYGSLYGETLINNKYVNNLKLIEDLEPGTRDGNKFVKANELEVSHQLYCRGPINHIGTILNPLNEFINGKSPNQIFMQYGFGNTLLMKWVMERFGGVSLHNYFKNYVFYVIYAAFFLTATALLFRNGLFTLNAFMLFSSLPFALGYIAFIIAPGIIPSIRIFDILVLLTLTLYFRSSSLIFLALSFAGTAGALLLNRNYGIMLLVSCTMAILFHNMENRVKSNRLFWLIIVTVLSVTLLYITQMMTPNAHDKTLTYFLYGYFSFRPETGPIVLVIVYLSLSYFFLVKFRDYRDPLKYICIFLFAYVQCRLTYFFWSGLNNHIPTEIPFIGVHLLLMLMMFKDVKKNKTVMASKYFTISMVVITCAISINYMSNLKEFYSSKKIFDLNFTEHKNFRWNFEKARLISTVDPKPFSDSVSIIERYIPNRSEGIYIISMHDNILPFLANRYSSMRYSDLSWTLFTDNESQETILMIRKARPQYIFVDSDLCDGIDDPWEPFFDSKNLSSERSSRSERKTELAKVFIALTDEYKKVDQKGLLSVYQRNNFFETKLIEQGKKTE